MKILVPLICLVCINLKSYPQHIAFKHGTAIITLVTKDSIWIAADSKQHYFNNPSDVSYSTVCKIRSYRGVHYSLAGNYLITDFETDTILFDSNLELIKVLKKNKPFMESVHEFESSILSNMNRFYKKVIDTAHQNFLNFLFTKNYAFAAIFYFNLLSK